MREEGERIRGRFDEFLNLEIWSILSRKIVMANIVLSFKNILQHFHGNQSPS